MVISRSINWSIFMVVMTTLSVGSSAKISSLTFSPSAISLLTKKVELECFVGTDFESNPTSIMITRDLSGTKSMVEYKPGMGVVRQTIPGANVTTATKDRLVIQWTDDNIVGLGGAFDCYISNILEHPLKVIEDLRLPKIRMGQILTTPYSVLTTLLEREENMKDFVLRTVKNLTTNSAGGDSEKCIEDSINSTIESHIKPHLSTVFKELEDIAGRLNSAVKTFEARLDSLESHVHALSLSRPWPNGRYAVFQPRTGCMDGDNWADGWIQVTTESSRPGGETRNNASAGNHFQTPLFETKGGLNVATLRYCVKTQNDFYAPPWPRGSYCINRVGGVCPVGFQAGRVQYDLEDDRTVRNKSALPDAMEDKDFLTIVYCCRHDGPPSERISLPPTKPFYLYRFPNMECQQVYGMNVTAETLTIDTQFFNNQDKFEDPDHPDGTLHPVTMNMCYYLCNHKA